MHEPTGPVTFHFYCDEVDVTLEIGTGGGEGPLYTLERKIAKALMERMILGDVEVTIRPHHHPFFKTKK